MASDLTSTEISDQTQEDKDSENVRLNTIDFQRATEEGQTTAAVRPPFCMNEDERKEKTFQERKTDVDGAIEWIKKEIKYLKKEDQNLMRTFVNLRGILNSLKNRPTLDRKTSLPENSPTSPLSPLDRISEDSLETFYAPDGSPGLRRRAQSAFAGHAPEYPFSPVSMDESDFGDDDETTLMI